MRVMLQALQDGGYLKILQDWGYLTRSCKITNYETFRKTFFWAPEKTMKIQFDYGHNEFWV